MNLFYFGNIAYWATIKSKGSITINRTSKIAKRSYINRTLIATANGIQTLSVPLKGGRGLITPFEDIKICYEEAWVHRHLMAFQSSYAKSPYFEFYGDIFAQILASKPPNLISLNLQIMEALIVKMKLKIDILYTDSEPQPVESLFKPNVYQAIPPYPQVYRSKYEFIPDLSILDLLYNLGPKSPEYLSNIELFTKS